MALRPVIVLFFSLGPNCDEWSPEVDLITYTLLNYCGGEMRLACDWLKWTWRVITYQWCCRFWRGGRGSLASLFSSNQAWVLWDRKCVNIAFFPFVRYENINRLSLFVALFTRWFHICVFWSAEVTEKVDRATGFKLYLWFWSSLVCLGCCRCYQMRGQTHDYRLFLRVCVRVSQPVLILISVAVTGLFTFHLGSPWMMEKWGGL